MKGDPTKGNKDPKTHKVTSPSGKSTTEVTTKSVKDAKANKNAFKERPAYKGKEHKTKEGKIYGTTSHAGVFTRTTSPMARRKAKKAQRTDRALHRKDSISHSTTIKRFKSATPKGTD